MFHQSQSQSQSLSLSLSLNRNKHLTLGSDINTLQALGRPQIPHKNCWSDSRPSTCLRKYYRKKWAKAQRPPAAGKIQRTFAKAVRAVPAEYPLRSYLALSEVQQRAVDAGAVKDARSWRRLLDSACFLAVNGRSVSVDGGSEQPLTVEAAFLKALTTATKPRPKLPVGDVTLHTSSFASDHARIRGAAYPYTPACNSGVDSRDDLIETRVGGAVSGYVVVDLDSGYIDDLCVDPQYSGLGLGPTAGAAAEAVLNQWADATER